MPTIYNSRKEGFKKPFGALKTDESVRFAVHIPKELNCKTPVLFMEKAGVPAKQYPMHADGAKGNSDLFSAKLSLKEPGLYFYWFDLWVDYKKLCMDKGGEAYLCTELGEKFCLTVYDGEYKTPEGLKGSVMYQIFPDRFLEGNSGKELVYNERIYRADKQNEPYFWGEEKSYGSLTQDYYGGDFAGIQKRMPFLHALGVEWVYLNPIFEAHSNHRYNTADYFKADPYLGTNEDFEALCKEAKGFGIKIILDGVFSHTGADSVYFNKEGRYPSVGAWQAHHSEYRDWFTFNNDGTYSSWWGFETLPNCNKQNPGFRQFIAGEGGVVDHWMKLGASGFRLDVADELPDDFIAEIRTAVKRHGADKVLIGEVWEDAALKEAYGVRREYFQGKELDGVMNYPFRTAIIGFLQNRDAKAFKNAVMSICENYPAPALSCCTTHLSTHDTERIITTLAGDKVDGHDRSWQSGRKLSQEQYHMGALMLRLAFVLQFTLPGVPCVYYGDEIAMQGYADPFNRAYYDWSSAETGPMELMMHLSVLRKKCPAFKEGAVQFSLARNGILVYERVGGDEKSAIAINCSGWAAVVTLLGEELTVANMDFAIRASNCEFAQDE